MRAPTRSRAKVRAQPDRRLETGKIWLTPSHWGRRLAIATDPAKSLALMAYQRLEGLGQFPYVNGLFAAGDIVIA